MSRVTEAGMEEGQGSRSNARSDEPEARSEVRWSARRKEGVVMRLLRGESLDLLARETRQPAGRISGWREEFLAAGREGLKSRPGGVEDVALREAGCSNATATAPRPRPASTYSLTCWHDQLLHPSVR